MELIEKLGIAAIPVITVICFLVAEAIKATSLDNKWLPIICGCAGGVLGVVAMYIMPDFPGTDILTAIAIGIISGLSATGAHQIYKQLTKGPDETGNTSDTGAQVDDYSGKH